MTLYTQDPKFTVLDRWSCHHTNIHPQHFHLFTYVTYILYIDHRIILHNSQVIQSRQGSSITINGHRTIVYNTHNAITIIEYNLRHQNKHLNHVKITRRQARVCSQGTRACSRNQIRFKPMSNMDVLLIKHALDEQDDEHAPTHHPAWACSTIFS